MVTQSAPTASTPAIPRIDVERREKLGSRESVRVRKADRLPAVVYGHHRDPLHVSIDRKTLVDMLHKRVRLFEVVCGGEVEPCIVKEVQWDHLGSSIVHLDLERVDLNEKVTVEVDVQFIGDPRGLKEAGAILEKPLTSIEVECLASRIPDRVVADISDLGVNDALTVAQLKLPEGVTTPLDPETIIAAIHVVQEVVEPAPTAEGEAPAEPKVIGKKTEEEAPAEGDAKAKAEKK